MSGFDSLFNQDTGLQFSDAASQFSASNPYSNSFSASHQASSSDAEIQKQLYLEGKISFWDVVNGAFMGIPPSSVSVLKGSGIDQGIIPDSKQSVAQKIYSTKTRNQGNTSATIDNFWSNVLDLLAPLRRYIQNSLPNLPDPLKGIAQYIIDHIGFVLLILLLLLASRVLK